MIYYVSAKGDKQVLLDTLDHKIMANDISFDKQSKTLFVPSFSSNRITGYKLIEAMK